MKYIALALVLPFGSLFICCMAAFSVSGYSPPETFVYLPIDANDSLPSGRSIATELNANIQVYYAPPMEEKWRTYFLTIRNSGKGVFIVVGGDVNYTWDVWDAFEEINTIVDYFQDVVTGFILWDDPQTDDGTQIEVGMQKRNLIASLIRNEWGDGIILGISVQPLADGLEYINFTPFNFILGYHYCWLDSTGWEGDWQRIQATDPGALIELERATKIITDLADARGIDAWFMLAAHSDQPYTTTQLQMYRDLELVKESNIQTIGWFTIDLIPGASGNVTWKDSVFIGSTNASADAWIRFSYLKILLGVASYPTTQQLKAEMDEIIANLSTMNQTLNIIKGNLSQLAGFLNQTCSEIAANLSTMNQTLHQEIVYRTSQVMNLLNETSDNLSFRIRDIEDIILGIESRLDGIGNEISLLERTLGEMNESFEHGFDQFDVAIDQLDFLQQELDRMGESLPDLIDGVEETLSKLVGVVEANITLGQEVLLDKIMKKIDLDRQKLGQLLGRLTEAENHLLAENNRTKDHLEALINGLRNQLEKNRADSKRDLALVIIIFAVIIFVTNTILLFSLKTTRSRETDV